MLKSLPSKSQNVSFIWLNLTCLVEQTMAESRKKELSYVEKIAKLYYNYIIAIVVIWGLFIGAGVIVTFPVVALFILAALAIFWWFRGRK